MESLRATMGALPNRHRTLAEKVYVALHDAIVTGVLEPGERLQIDDLAEAFEVSSMPIREAVRRLDSVGLIESLPHRGARVTELSVADLIEVYEARLALEPLAGRRAAMRFADEDRDAAERALARHVEAAKRGSVGEIWAAHTDFHFAIYRAGGSRWLLRLIKPLWESSERYRLASRFGGRGVAERQEEHERILDACVSHDPDRAQRELRNHLCRTANAIAVGLGRDALYEIE